MSAKRKTKKSRKTKSARVVKAKAGRAPKSKAAPSQRPSAAPRAALPATKAPKRAAPTTMYGLLHPAVTLQEEFRDAPDDWTPDLARTFAAGANLRLMEDHWEVIRVLQGCYKDEVSPRLRLLRDALEARFASKGGMKYLFGILPGGPIAQGCGLAGLKPPHGAKDLSFGSVA